MNSSKNGQHVLVAYIMKPKAGYDYLATAAHFAAESSTGTNVNVCTTDDFTKSVDALVYYIDPDEEEMKIAYPTMLFDRNKDGPKQGAMSCRQGEEAWKLWKAGTYGDVSLSDGVVEYAKTHEEIKGAFLTFQKDVDQIYPGWKEKLGYTGESSVQ